MKIVEITYRYDADAGATPVGSRPADAQAAVDRLNAGNRAFGKLLDDLSDGMGTGRRIIEVDPRDLGFVHQGEDAAPTQRPFAAVLGCSDARVPIELIFNEGPNDLFVVRVAGNGLGSDVGGSLNYAIEHLAGSLRLVVVLGHSGCGAVGAAVDVFLNPSTYLSLVAQHALRSILDRLIGVVHACARKMASFYGPDVTRRPGYREALIETSIVVNAALTAYTLQHEIGDAPTGGIRTVYGVYLIATRQVWAPRSGSTDCSGLAHAPTQMEAVGDFVDAVLRSERIASILGSE